MKLNAEVIIDDLLEKEKSFFENSTKEEVDRWIAIRFYVLSKILSAKCDIKSPYEPRFTDIVLRTLKGVGAIFDLLSLKKSLSSPSILCLMHERSRSGKDVYLENLIKAIPDETRGYRQIWIGDSRSYFSKPDVFNKKFYSIEFIKVVSKVVSRILFRFKSKKDAKKLVYYFTGEEIHSAEKEYVLRELESSIQKKMFSWVLSKNLDIKICFLSVYYCNVSLIQSIREKFADTVVIEAQHGLISKFHIGYSTFLTSSTSFPDLIGLFGSDWNNQLGITLNTFVIGSGLQEIPFIPTVEDNNEDKRVLIISQNAIAACLIRQITTCLAENPNIVFDIKLHPSEYSENEYGLLKNDPRIFLYKDVPLNMLLHRASFILGVYSTLLVELVQVGYSVNILTIDGSEKMPRLGKQTNFIHDIKDESLVGKSGSSEKLKLFERPNYEQIKKKLEEVIVGRL